MSVVIRLDVPALERLIGGTTEVEVELRKGVVEEFAKRHLTAVLKDEAFAKFISKEREVLSAALDAKVTEHVGKLEGPWNNLTVYLSDKSKAALEAETEKRISAIVRKAVDEVWARREQRIVAEVHKLISEKTDRLTETVIQDQVKARLKTIAEALKAS